MNDQMLAVLIAVIAAMPGCLVALMAWLATKKTHKLVNSRMDELLRMARREATDDERDRVAREASD